MSDVRRLVDQLGLDVEAIVAGLAPALAHLEEWTGEFPGSASGAPPSSGGSPPAQDDDDHDEDAGVVLTRFELLATSGDPAVRHRLALLGHLRYAAGLARSTMADIDGVSLPVVLTTDSEDLAVLRWAVRRLRSESGSVEAGRLARLCRAVFRVRGLVEFWAPPAASVPSGCRLHRQAGDHVEISRHFQGLGLCRRCGEFRRAYTVDPSPAILRAWSKGQKPTAGQVADAIAAGKKKRRRRKKAS
jgi:hypothetical protein